MSKKLVKLKPCPFCGEEGKRIEICGLKYVQCNNIFCLIRPRTLYCTRYAEAVKAWNRRTNNG